MVLTVLIALSYYGVLDVKGMAMQFMPKYCKLDYGLECLDHEVSVYGSYTKKNRLELAVTNNLASHITITDVSIPELNHNGQVFPIVGLSQGQSTIAPNLISVDDITQNKPPYMPSGTAYSFDIVVRIINDDTGLPHEFKGHIRGKVR